MVVRRLWELQRLGKLSEVARERERNPGSGLIDKVNAHIYKYIYIIYIIYI